MADILSKISIGMFIVAVIFFIIAIILFVVFNIPYVVGDLSGKNAQRSIEKLRAVNEKTENKSYRSGTLKVERGKITAPINLADNKNVGSPRYNATETSLLGNHGNVSVNNIEQTRALMNNDDTQPLFNGEENNTVALKNNTYINCNVEEKCGICKKIQIIEEVIMIHTDEVLQL